MNHIGYDYEVTARLQFTDEELKALAILAEHHYDDTCRATVAVADKSGRRNGILVIAGMRNGLALWTSREVDLMLKVLEMRAMYHRAKVLDDTELWLCDCLNKQLREVFLSMQLEYSLLCRREFTA